MKDFFKRYFTSPEFLISVCIVLAFLILGPACSGNNPDAAKPVYPHVDGMASYDQVKDIHQLDGYTVVEKYTDTYTRSARIFVVKTEYFEIFKQTGRGLAEQGVKGRLLDVRDSVFDSCFQGEAIKPVNR
jgi:hypothetical protein